MPIFQVCRLLRGLVASTLFLQYILELDMCGYVVPAIQRPDMTHAEMVKMISEHRKRQQRDTLTNPTFFPFLSERERTDAIAFEDGVFACGYTNTTDPEGPIHIIHFDQLPSPNKGTGHERWQHGDFGFNVIRFLIQPEQDLLVLLEEDLQGLSDHPIEEISASDIERDYRIHLRTMSTNEPHPAATSPTGTVMDLNLVEHSDMRFHEPHDIQVNGCLISVVFGGRQAPGIVFILVIDWVAGVQVAVSAVESYMSET